MNGWAVVNAWCVAHWWVPVAVFTVLLVTVNARCTRRRHESGHAFICEEDDE